MLRFVLIASSLTCLAYANTQPNLYPQPREHQTMQQRSGFGLNAGFGSPDLGLGVNGGFQVGAPNINFQALMPIFAALGFLLLLNIAVTVLAPLLAPKPKRRAGTVEGEEEEEVGAPEGRAIDMINLASNVYEAIQKLGEQQKME